jgi:hypothetical protein
MKTKYLDNKIELLNAIERNNELSDYGREKLIEFNAIKKALTIPVVVGQSEQLNTAWKALEWVGFERGNEFDDDDINEMLGI